MSRFGQLPDHERCTATAKSTGERCEKPRAYGATVCRTHGASAPQVKAAGEKRRSTEKAERAVATYGLPVEIDPHDALLAEVHRTAGHVAWLADVVRNIEDDHLVFGVTRIKDGGDDRGTTFEAAPSVWLDLYQRERAHLVKVAKAAIDAGIDERRVKLAEEQGAIIVQVLKATLEELGVEVTPEVAQTVGRHLRAVS